MKYFRFFPDHYFIAGPVKCAIYDLTHSKTITFSKDESIILRKLITNINVEEVTKEFGNQAKDLISKLIINSYGTYFEKPVFMEPYIPTSKIESTGIYNPAPSLNLAYIQLDDECTTKCNFCGEKSFFYLQGCNTCLKWPNSKGEKLIDKVSIEKTLQQLIDLEVRNIIFSGGNPLLYWSKVVEAIKFIEESNKKVNISINTNGFGFSKEIQKYSIDHKISYCFSLFADTPERYESVIGSDKQYFELCNAIEICKKYTIPYSVCLLVVPELRNNFNEIYNFAKTLGGFHLYTSEILPKNSIKREFTVSLPHGEERVENISRNEFSNRSKYNTCLNGAIAVSCNGATLPCPMWEHSLSQLPKGDLISAFKSGEVDEIWSFSKNKVSICNECENRFACSDCSILEWASSNDKSIHSKYCSYVPLKGEWV